MCSHIILGVFDYCVLAFKLIIGYNALTPYIQRFYIILTFLKKKSILKYFL